MKHKHSKKKKHVMHSLEEMDRLYVKNAPPIYPQGKDVGELSKKEFEKKYGDKGEGWQYYHQVRNNLPEWWEEFNGDLDKYGRLKYTTIMEFIRSKVHNRKEIAMLYAMLGPFYRRDKDDKNYVPWLGDWEKRRRNGFCLLDAPDKIKPLLKVIKENLDAANSIRQTAPFLIEDLATYSALQRQVHEAFAGQAFAKGKAANDKVNIGRFEVYKNMISALSVLKQHVIKEIMRVYGVNPDIPNQMRDMVQIAGGIGAAAALTGIASAQQIPGLGQGIPTQNGMSIVPYTYDAIQMATHLTKHAHTFKKPLPVIDADPSSYEEDSSSSTPHKGNGKVV